MPLCHLGSRHLSAHVRNVGLSCRQMFFFAPALPSQELLTSMGSRGQVMTWAQLEDEIWKAVTGAMGDEAIKNMPISVAHELEFQAFFSRRAS